MPLVKSLVIGVYTRETIFEIVKAINTNVYKQTTKKQSYGLIYFTSQYYELQNGINKNNFIRQLVSIYYKLIRLKLM